MTQSVADPRLERTIVRDFLGAIILHAERCAALTVAALDAFELSPLRERRSIHLPEAFLLELAAVMELRCWEASGTRDHIDAGLPSFGDAARELGSRAERGPQEFADRQAATLSSRLFKFWLSKFAWDGIAILGADIIVNGVDEELFINSVAEFLWENRAAMSKLLDE